MSDTLEWYAKRGLLAASDEPEEQNMRRLRMGRRIAKLAMATRRRGDLVASYAPRVGGGGRSHDALTVVEQDMANRELLGGVMRYVPPRSRAAAVEDRIVETTTICPPLVEYDPDFLAQAADEISALPETSKLIRLAHDYGTLRAMIRQC